VIKYSIKILFPLAFFVLVNTKVKGQGFHTVPEQTLNLYELIGYLNEDRKDTIKAFGISDFITYKEYKKYLNSIKRDSSEQFYTSQLPDTNITIDKTVYQEYITSNVYDNYPVLGISWENAMNYCKWKTLKDNKKGEIKFIYRLPKGSEWVATLNFCTENNIKLDMDDKYSDWILNSFDETIYNFYMSEFDYVYLHKEDDLPVLKRKWTVGESYLYYIPSLIDGYPSIRYGYSYIGYQHIAFRIVITKADKSILNYWGLGE
jgi:Sulfatase-modifying factor enzyme 1